MGMPNNANEYSWAHLDIDGEPVSLRDNYVSPAAERRVTVRPDRNNPYGGKVSKRESSDPDL
jgi:hypothetical protein